MMGEDGSAFEGMLPSGLYFSIAMIARALNGRLQRKLDRTAHRVGISQSRALPFPAGAGMVCVESSLSSRCTTTGRTGDVANMRDMVLAPEHRHASWHPGVHARRIAEALASTSTR